MMFLPAWQTPLMLVTPMMDAVSPSTASDDSQRKKDDARLRKQKYNRDRLRQKRTEYMAEFQALEAQIRQLVDLRDEALRGKQIGVLPWVEVAAALKADSSLSQMQNRELLKQVRAAEALCKSLRSWVASRIVHATLNPEHTSWRESMIPKDDASRKLGLDWISKRLYHNLNGVIEASGLPGPIDKTAYYRIDVERQNDTYRLSEFKQRVERVRFDIATRTLSAQYFETFDGDEEERQNDDMTYIRYPSLYGRTNNVPYTEKMLVRQFKEQHRFVIFTHGVPDDAKYQDPIRCDWSAWVVVTDLGANECLLQFGYTAYGLRCDDGYLPFEVEMPALAAFSGDDDDTRFARFRHKQRDDRLRRQMEDVAAFQERCRQMEAAVAPSNNGSSPNVIVP
ncbi:hypothetical protein SDRG_01705 [Saprolegnia diclina VS20]|uniref:Uncharacterized protein n=1 Tax=Saprolegnia diclina (strain VS20) TaxID=1156394 RepID=T0SCP3_SAPDV|nr:hypothetical protein SDRG_01705 [Saprolegnia diclina VS20]EQC40622.1 hypothetical protein SDRG_01705 [Saprolegnia diclina VS20]|eukprot:XP_008605466.1 hypothetical protein SDRG_01705 [Saprolegnia diclina VS20]